MNRRRNKLIGGLLGLSLVGCTANNAVTPTFNSLPDQPQWAADGIALNRYVVTAIDQGAIEPIRTAGLSHGLKVEREIPEIATIVFSGNVTTARQAMANIAGIETQGPDFAGKPQFTPSDVEYANQYAPQMVGLPDAWDVMDGAEDVIIAVVDSGANDLHPDLADRLVPGKDIINWNGNKQDASPDPLSATRDTFGHGSHCAGAAAAAVDNGIGISGAAINGRIMPIKISEKFGDIGLNSANTAAGIVWAADHGAKVMSISLSWTNNSPAIEKAVRYAQSKDVLIVAAAGNWGGYLDGSSNKGRTLPATLPGVLAVGAIGPNLESTWDALNGAPAGTSNYGQIGLVAPGIAILSTVGVGIFGDYVAWSGTSMATPLVAGVAALYRGKYPQWSAARIKNTLERSASTLGGSSPSHHTDQYGYGLLNAAFIKSDPGCYYEGDAKFCPGDVGYN